MVLHTAPTTRPARTRARRDAAKYPALSMIRNDIAMPTSRSCDRAEEGVPGPKSPVSPAGAPAIVLRASVVATPPVSLD
jgi:hypothetical protein